jgi:hypothetical protein
MTSKEDKINSIKEQYRVCLDSENECNICYQPLCNITEEDVTGKPFSQRFTNLTTDVSWTLNCGHTFHRPCILNWVKTQAPKNEGIATCPTCRTNIESHEITCNCDNIVTQLNNAAMLGGKNKRHKKLKSKKQKRIKHKNKTFRKKYKI